MKIIPAKINGIRIESLPNQVGDSRKKTWESPVKLHAIASIDDIKSKSFNEFFQLQCLVRSDGEPSDNVKFIHGNSGCNNPCKMRQLTGQDLSEMVFTFEVISPGNYEVFIGNNLDVGFTTSFEVY